MAQDIYLTGITTTGTPHIGNYVGAIRPGIAASNDKSKQNYYFLADYHALAKAEDPADLLGVAQGIQLLDQVGKAVYIGNRWKFFTGLSHDS